MTAKYNNPSAIAADGKGILYVADTDNHRIRKIDKDGNVTTFAGSQAGFSDGKGNNAKFNKPTGLAVDKNGWVYVADQLNHRIRKISPDGDVTTYAGSTRGLKDGYGSEAQFSFPSGIAVDSNGMVFVADYGNHVIREISQDGTAQILAGNGVSGNTDGLRRKAQFSFPYALAIGDAGELYVADYGNHRIRKIDNKGAVTTFAGTDEGYVDQHGAVAKFSEPTGLAIDYSDYNGYLYVTDRGNNCIRIIKRDGRVGTFAGGQKGYSEGRGTEAKFNAPTGIAFFGRSIFIADVGNNCIRTVEKYGKAADTYTGHIRGMSNGHRMESKFNLPASVESDAKGTLYIADSFNHCIRRVSADGIVTTVAGSTRGFRDAKDTLAQFNNPSDVAVDAAGTLYVADKDNHCIRKVSADGTVTTFAGSTDGSSGDADGNGTAARFFEPSGIAIDVEGTLYVTDHWNHRIRKVSKDGKVTTLAGSAEGYADGKGTAAKFNHPMDIAVDVSGTVFVADAFNHRIRKISPDGTVTTVAGSSPGYADGVRTFAQFNRPAGIAVNANGILYVTDAWNYRIRSIQTDGMVSTLAGSTQGYENGVASQSKFQLFSRLSLDAKGDLYVADTYNHRIRKITFGTTSVESLVQNSASWTISPNPTTSTLRISIP
ncbi:MAG: SMP-30/gluconolactonase/LRE family protein, partial [Candidatus Kapabacteria bacterium]|nr:SMP-30/gluconolactonase/LRE family protein [Candidatus Kapabacteria bacterium]